MVNSLLFAIPGIGNVLLVCVVFWLIFSIVGVQFFGGKFFRCVDIHGERLPVSTVPNKTECHRLSYRWINANINFDNVLNGLIALFQVVSLYLLPTVITRFSKQMFHLLSPDRPNREIWEWPRDRSLFSFLAKLNSFALASKARIILHYSHLCTRFFRENINADLTFAVCSKRDS